MEERKGKEKKGKEREESNTVTFPKRASCFKTTGVEGTTAAYDFHFNSN